MDFIQFTEKFKTEDNSALIESIQNGYRIILEAEEKLYTDNEGNTRARVMINNIDDIDWLNFFEECVAESRKLKNDEDYEVRFEDIITKYIEKSVYGGSADWGGELVFHFDKDVESPGYEGRYIASSDSGWVVGHRKYDENGESDWENELIDMVEYGSDPIEIFNTLYTELYKSYGRDVPFSFDESTVETEELEKPYQSEYLTSPRLKHQDLNGKLEYIFREYSYLLPGDAVNASNTDKLNTIKQNMLKQIDDENDNIKHKNDLSFELEEQAEKTGVSYYMIEDELRSYNNSAAMSRNVINSYNKVIKSIDELLERL